MLQISAVTQADDGEYICLSTVGETARISVSVPGKPACILHLCVSVLLRKFCTWKCVMYSLILAVVNDCLNAPCQNNGKCKDRIAGYECACVEGFLGTNCSERGSALPSAIMIGCCDPNINFCDVYNVLHNLSICAISKLCRAIQKFPNCAIIINCANINCARTHCADCQL